MLGAQKKPMHPLWTHGYRFYIAKLGRDWTPGGNILNCRVSA
jgi:hypothetical protein